MFTSDRIVRGEMTSQYDKPEWGPFEVELESGLRLHAYKHIETRKYQLILREVLRRRGE